MTRNYVAFVYSVLLVDIFSNIMLSMHLSVISVMHVQQNDVHRSNNVNSSRWKIGHRIKAWFIVIDFVSINHLPRTLRHTCHCPGCKALSTIFLCLYGRTKRCIYLPCLARRTKRKQNKPKASTKMFLLLLYRITETGTVSLLTYTKASQTTFTSLQAFLSW